MTLNELNDSLLRDAAKALADLKQYHHTDNFQTRLETITEALIWSEALYQSLRGSDTPVFINTPVSIIDMPDEKMDKTPTKRK